MVGLRPYDAESLIRNETSRNALSKPAPQSNEYPNADLLVFPLISEPVVDTRHHEYSSIPIGAAVEDAYLPPENAPPLLDDDFMSYDFDVASLMSTSVTSQPGTSLESATAPMIQITPQSSVPYQPPPESSQQNCMSYGVPVKYEYSSPKRPSYRPGFLMPTPDPLTPSPIYQQATTASPLVTNQDAKYISPSQSDETQVEEDQKTSTQEKNEPDMQQDMPTDILSPSSKNASDSEATAALRRAKNTMAARRSRARKADKIAELQRENESLAMRLCMASYENEKLQSLVMELRSQLRHR